MLNKAQNRVKRAAQLIYHCEYGGNLNAIFRSEKELASMSLTEEERQKAEEVVKWMEKQAREKDRWF